ncbi:hypothetical protein BJV74DRAFT_838777 [Russula compacta]|nr:hypothetical protein BJV74DRAFT_838777 [Russula compacta]
MVTSCIRYRIGKPRTCAFRLRVAHRSNATVMSATEICDPRRLPTMKRMKPTGGLGC